MQNKVYIVEAENDYGSAISCASSSGIAQEMKDALIGTGEYGKYDVHIYQVTLDQLIIANKVVHFFDEEEHEK